ncbi:MAG: VWA domain-containing protein [Pseudorhodoplanes sp.]|nr:VWA domain-containing protein [Pseudorhodoplanes sp.]
MAKRSLFSLLLDGLRAFSSDKSGNVVITFALATIPIIGFTGAAVDYSRGNSAKAAMQAATDATALILSKEAQSLTDAQLKAKALSYFTANFNRPEVYNIVVTPTFTQPAQGNFTLNLVSSGKLKTTFTGIWQPTLTIGADTQVNWGMKKLELALALDNTGSMAWSNKMTHLKTATKNLLSTLQKAAKKDGDVKVAIIPFDTTVNLGTSYKDQPWFDIDSIDCNGWNYGTGCTSSNWKNYWEGCVRDRTYPYDTTDDSPDKNKAQTLFPVYDCGSLAKLLPLTTNWTALNSKVDQMQPNGMTNVTIGLAWGFHALTQSAPLSEAAAPATDLDKVLIILTDGTNTQSWKNQNNTIVNQSNLIDARTKLACDNIKQANIKIYAIRVIDGNSKLLKECATNPTMYYDVQNASELSGVFSAIAQNLANLRLAK